MATEPNSEEKKVEKNNPATPRQVMQWIDDAAKLCSSTFMKELQIKGIYERGSNKDYNGYFYDTLNDEYHGTTLKIKVPILLRDRLNDKSLVVLNGMIDSSCQKDRSSIEYHLVVDGIVEEVRQNAINEIQLQRLALVQEKNSKGRKPVRANIRDMIIRNKKPRILLIYAETTITDQDFERAKGISASEIVFEAKYVSFGSIPFLINVLKEADKAGYDAISLIRGGGSGMDKLEDLQLYRCLIDMKTPTFGGVSHVGEGFHITDIFDDNAGTPSLLGQALNDIVTEAVQQREGTLSNLRESIEKQYEPQLKRLHQVEKQLLANDQTILKLQNDRNLDIQKQRELNQQIAELKNQLNKASGNINPMLIVAAAIVALIIGIIATNIYFKTVYDYLF